MGTHKYCRSKTHIVLYNNMCFEMEESICIALGVYIYGEGQTHLYMSILFALSVQVTHSIII